MVFLLYLRLGQRTRIKIPTENNIIYYNDRSLDKPVGLSHTHTHTHDTPGHVK